MRNAETLDALIEVFTDRGFVDLSVEDMARLSRRSKSTLYGVAASKEGIITATIREFFRRATERVEKQVAGGSPAERLGSYLTAISAALAPASAQFFADLDSFAPAREIYQANTRVAAQRVQQLALAALPAESTLNPRFVGVVAGLVIEAIQRGEVEGSTGLTASDAYSALSELISASIRSETIYHRESGTE